MGRALPALRLAAAHTLRQPVRTGMTAAMFSLVVLMLTVMQVITAAAVRFHGDPKVVYGGWQIEGQVRAALPAPEGVARADAGGAVPDAATGTGAIPQVSQALASGAAPAASAVGGSGIAEAVRVAGAAAAQPALKELVSGAGLRATGLFPVLQLDAPTPAWGGYPVAGIDAAFAAANALPLQARAEGYATDGDVWRAVASGTGLAVIDAQSFPSPQLRATSNVNVLSFTLRGLTHNTDRFAPLPVWIGNPAGKTVTRVQVIGIVDARVASAFRGLHVSLAQLQALGPPVRPASARLYFQVRDGADVTAARTALGETFFDAGLETVSLLDRFVNENGPLVLASRLLQLFVGLGLGAGVAELAVISTRAALERRQLIGIMRAIGYPRSTIQASLLLEAALVVLIGCGLGVALGLVLCRNIFAVQFFDRFQQGMRLVVPWDLLGLTVLATALAAVAATWAPAWQAARIPPVAAIREG
jgi:putative ABC transport system permease protein